MKRIGVKYCGGCDSLYDRVKMIEAIARKLEGNAIFLSHEDQPYDFLLIVNGCPRACADREDIHALCPDWMSLNEEGDGLALDLVQRLKMKDRRTDYDKDKRGLYKESKGTRSQGLL